MSKYVSVKNMKTGDKYFFVDTDFRWGNIKLPTIKQRTIYRIVGGDFSTKETDDRYEVVRVIAHKSKADAKDYAIRELERYREHLNGEITDRIKEVMQS